MAITAYGFDGSMSEAAWAALATMAGSVYPTVSAHSAYTVSVGGGGDRAVTVGTGRSFAHGILSINDAPVVMNATVVTVGTVRYDTVALRINWTSNTVQVVVVSGGTTSGLAAGLNSSPGTIFDHPLSIIQISSSSLTIQSVLDVRNWGSSALAVQSVDGLPPAASVPRNTIASVSIASTTQPVALYAAFNSSWVPIFGPSEWRALPIPSGLAVHAVTPTFTRMAGVVFLAGGLERSNGTAVTSRTLGAVTMGTLPIGYRPGRTLHFATAGDFASGTDNVRLTIRTDGTIAAETADAALYAYIDCNFPAEG